MTNCVFLDASFWISYRDERDARSREAGRILGDLFRQKTYFVVTMPVLCEIHAAFARSRRKREQVLNDLWDNPLVKIEDVSHHDQREAIELLRDQKDKTYPFCDAISFVVMRRMGIRRALSFDQHFCQFGEFQIIS